MTLIDITNHSNFLGVKASAERCLPVDMWNQVDKLALYLYSVLLNTLPNVGKMHKEL